MFKGEACKGPTVHRKWVGACEIRKKVSAEAAEVRGEGGGGAIETEVSCCHTAVNV